MMLYASLLLLGMTTFDVLNQFDYLDQELELLNKQLDAIEHTLDVKRQAQEHVKVIISAMERVRAADGKR